MAFSQLDVPKEGSLETSSPDAPGSRADSIWSRATFLSVSTTEACYLSGFKVGTRCSTFKWNKTALFTAQWVDRNWQPRSRRWKQVWLLGDEQGKKSPGQADVGNRKARGREQKAGRYPGKAGFNCRSGTGRVINRMQTTAGMIHTSQSTTWRWMSRSPGLLYSTDWLRS